ncbi:hypothetical protein K1719_018653 [Acacia pycnantha]|nr:hypothetical protein K1719_018653 [Acacia pycnantha]
MNPKISDFGMARIFGLRESEENTVRVVGTLGYMAPEYAINDCPLNLIGYAWLLWNEGRALELIDSAIYEASVENKVQRERSDDGNNADNSVAIGESGESSDVRTNWQFDNNALQWQSSSSKSQ